MKDRLIVLCTYLFIGLYPIYIYVLVYCTLSGRPGETLKMTLYKKNIKKDKMFEKSYYRARLGFSQPL